MQLSIPTFAAVARNLRNSTLLAFKMICEVLDFSSILLVIQKHIRKLTPIEEMLLSPVISNMSVFWLPTGGHVSHGYVANFKQDVARFIREIPLTAAQLPCIVIRTRGVETLVQNSKFSADFSFRTIQDLCPKRDFC
jgi:hypothetical protein